ncbi:MAG: NAD-dependent epimerase/dehydratase family protein [Gemmatimonadota bacterium]
MRVIITGGAGFIGSHLVDRLLERNEHVTVIDNFDSFYDPQTKRENIAAHLENARFRLLEGDLLRTERFEPKLQGGADALVHLAARPGITASIHDSRLYARVNVEGTAAALELARRLNIRRFIFGSSSSVYGAGARLPFRESDPADRPISPYAATKRAGELLCHAHHHIHGGSTVCLRLFTVYGPRQRPDLAIHKFARLMSASEPLPLYGSGDTARDYIYVDDVVRGIEAAIDYTGENADAYELVNLGRGDPVSLDRLVRLLAAALGTEAHIRLLPPRQGDVPRTWAGTGKARELLGYAPAITIDEGIRRFAKWYRAEGS